LELSLLGASRTQTPRRKITLTILRNWRETIREYGRIIIMYPLLLGIVGLLFVTIHPAGTSLTPIMQSLVITVCWTPLVLVIVLVIIVKLRR